jgi:hypothetical protein
MISEPKMCYCSLAYSALASFRMGMSGFPQPASLRNGCRCPLA